MKKTGDEKSRDTVPLNIRHLNNVFLSDWSLVSPQSCIGTVSEDNNSLKSIFKTTALYGYF
jgi:hypothetical protein